MENTHRRIEKQGIIRFTSAYHISATLNDQTRARRKREREREGRKKLVSPLFTVDHSWILHKQSGKRERLGCLDDENFLESRLIPVYMTSGRGRARHEKGVRDSLVFLGRFINDTRVTVSVYLFNCRSNFLSRLIILH